MSRFMTIWLPRWPVQRRLLDRPELREVPLFVCRRERRGAMTVVSWAWAEPPRLATQTGARSRGGPRATISPGMSLAEAMAVLALAHGSRACHIAEVEHDDPAADRAALERLTRWCRRFSPLVGIEAAAAAPSTVAAMPECIQLDVTGTVGFFGGEGSLARTAVWTLAARGLHARTAIADTCSAAWAAAHHTDVLEPPAAAGTITAATVVVHRGEPGSATPARRFAAPRRRRRWAVVPPGETAAMLAGLPVSALRLDAATSAALGEVGIDSIGGVLGLSGRSLASRFPPLLSRRLAEFRGTVPEPIVPPCGEALPQASHAFDFPVVAADVEEEMLVGLIGRLLKECLAPLVARGEGVLAVQVRLEHGSRRVSAAPTVVDVGLFRPAVSLSHLVELVRLRLRRIRMPAEIDGIAVEVVAAGAVSCRQRLLFGAGGDSGGFEVSDADVEVGMLLDRLSGRLGRTAVFEPQPVGDAQPEHAWIATPPGGRKPLALPAARPSPQPRRGAESTIRDRVSKAGARGYAFARHVPAGRRPIWMPPRPLPLEAEMVSVVPDGPPVRFRFGDRLHRIVQAHGPERIETAWWRGATVRRDYYVVETESGERFWVFRRLKDGGWFLHGMFA